MATQDRAVAVSAMQPAAAGSSMEPAAKEEDKASKPAAGVTKEDKREPAEDNGIIRLPDWFIKRTEKRGLRRPRPLREGFLDDDPEFREMVLASKAAANAFVDVEEDILMQVRDKGYAEVMLEYVDGVAKLGSQARRPNGGCMYMID